MRNLLLCVSLAVLSACADPTGVPGVSGNGSSAIDQAPSQRHMQLARAAGLNPPSAISGAARAEGGLARDVVLAGAMTANPVGMSSAAGLAGGVIGILASPPAPAEMWDKTIVRLPAGQSAAAFSRQMQDAIEKMTGPWARPGYAAIELAGQRLYSNCGGGGNVRPAMRCLEGIEVILTPVGRLDGDTVYVMRTQEYGKADFLSANPLNNVSQHKALSRAFPGKVFTYLAPRRVRGGWSPAGIYDAGKTYPL